MVSSSSISANGRRHFELEGIARCECGVKEVLWTSWTDLNPGRRFFGCRNYSPPKERVKKKGCEHFVWYDAEMPRRAKEVINELKKEKKLLRKENNELIRRCDGQWMFDEIKGIKEEVKNLRKIKGQLKRAHIALVVSCLFMVLMFYFIFVL